MQDDNSHEFVTIARIGQIPDEEGRTFSAGGREIAVFLHRGKYYAIDDYCPHMGASLGASRVRNGTAVCYQHLWSFRLADGTSPDAPTLRATTFEVRVVGDEIQVRLPIDQ